MPFYGKQWVPAYLAATFVPSAVSMAGLSNRDGAADLYIGELNHGRKQMSQSDQTDQIWAALAAAQGAMKNAAFDAVNPHFKNRYATLASVIDTAREGLSKAGIAVTHTNDVDGEQEYLVTTLGHKSGQWIQSRRRVPAGLKAQEYGAWLTYNRRYALCALIGISADEDDDGNVAQAASNGKQTVKEKYGTTPQDIYEDEIQYDVDGNPIDNIPYGNPALQQVRGTTSKKEYETLQSEMNTITSIKALREWANLTPVKDRVQTLTNEHQEYIRRLYSSRMRELGRLGEAALKTA
jgi:hypothetical protein